VLVLPGEDGSMTVTLNADKLPTQIVLRDANDAETARFDIQINKAIDLPAFTQISRGDPVDWALAAPFLRGLDQAESARALAERAVAVKPPTAEAFAARGLLRLADGPPEPGLEDLRLAAKLSKHPAYALLLAESLIAARQFTEARDLCRELIMKGTPLPAPAALDPADVLLASRISLRSAVDTLVSGPPNPRRRAQVNLALAEIGRKNYAAAAEQAQAILKAEPDNVQAAELLARSELGLKNPLAALAAAEHVPPADRPATLHVYAALARHLLKQETEAVAALAKAIRKDSSFRNLLRLQRSAEEIHPAFEPVAAKAALAKLFSRASMGSIPPDERARIAAIVNDAFILRSDVEGLAGMISEERPDADPAVTRRRALGRIIEDMLIIRWAMWNGLSADHEEVYRAMQDEMRQMGANSPEQYEQKLKDAGQSLEARRRHFIDQALKRRALSAVLAERVTVLPGDVRRYYEQNPKTFRTPRAAQFRMITLHFVRYGNRDAAVRAARTILDQLKQKPGSFAAIAREYSHDANAAKGGLWENVTEGSMLKGLNEAIFALKPGETSGIIETDRGCHIVRIEKMEPARTMPLKEVAEHLVRAMQEARARTEISGWLRHLRATSYLEIFDTP